MAQQYVNQFISLVHPICCGLDIHKKIISACLLYTDEEGALVSLIREFGTFTDDLMNLRDWLINHSCPIVAMESTGVYWCPVHNVLEGHVEVILVNPRHMKNVPGRKTDVADSQWLAGLLRHGLLKGSFIPPKDVRQWRDLTRLRRTYQETLGDFRRLTHKLFETANIKIGSVVSDLFGVTGRYLMNLLAANDSAITLTAIEKGARTQLKNKADELFRSIQGFFTDHHRYILNSLLETINNLEKQIVGLNQTIKNLQADQNPTIARLKEVPGISDVAAAIILSEIGPTLEEFPNSAALASWSGLCPGNNQSAGKRRSGRSAVRNHHLKTVMVEVAWSAIRKSGSYYKDKFHRLRFRRGAKRAIVAIAHRILKAIYQIIKHGERFRDLGEDFLTQKNQSRKLSSLKKQAQLLGYELTPLAA